MPSDAPGALQSVTGQASYPAVLYENEPPRSGWAEILLLAERLAPEPALVPADAEERARFFGAGARDLRDRTASAGRCGSLMIDGGMQSSPPKPR